MWVWGFNGTGSWNCSVSTSCDSLRVLKVKVGPESLSARLVHNCIRIDPAIWRRTWLLLGLVLESILLLRGLTLVFVWARKGSETNMLRPYFSNWYWWIIFISFSYWSDRSLCSVVFRCYQDTISGSCGPTWSKRSQRNVTIGRMDNWEIRYSRLLIIFLFSLIHILDIQDNSWVFNEDLLLFLMKIEKDLLLLNRRRLVVLSWLKHFGLLLILHERGLTLGKIKFHGWKFLMVGSFRQELRGWMMRHYRLEGLRHLQRWRVLIQTLVLCLNPWLLQRSQFFYLRLYLAYDLRKEDLAL